jgi:hypothetical protein
MNRTLQWAVLLLFLLLLSPFTWSQQHYAVIITGDRPNIDPSWMPPEPPPYRDDSYWNDTFMMWRTLVDNGWDPAKITVLYYDGQDYPTLNARYKIPPPGQITNLPATKANVIATFANLSTTMTNNDVLFIWTYDHGDNDLSHNNSSRFDFT